MATWKKIITSGSAAELSSLTLDTALPVAQGGIGAKALTDKAVLISQDSGTDAVGSLALTTNGSIIVGGTNGPAVEAAGDVAGTGLDASTGDGTLAINVAAAQTSITSIINSSLGKIGTAADQEYITFGTSNEVNTFVNDTERLSVSATGIEVTGVVTATGNISSSITSTGSFGRLEGDGSGLTGIIRDIDDLDALGGTGLHQTQDKFLFSDNGTEKSITFSNLEDAIFGNVSGDATIAAGGALSLANNSVGNAEMADNAIGNSELKQDDDITLQSLTTTNNVVVGGDLTVNGTTTTIATTNTKVEDQFMFLGTGSAGTNKDIGIIAQSGSTDLSGSALYHDTDSERWSVGKNVGQDVQAITPTSFVTTVKTDTVNPSSESGSYGAGEMHVNTSTGEIWIRFG
jgi:hypothetical protein